MADSRTIILRGPSQRQHAHQTIDQAPADSVVKVSLPRRTTPQNALMWSALGDISRAMPQGRRHTPDDWKALAMNACGWDCQFLEGLDGKPFPIGFRSSKLNKKQMSDLLTWIFSFGNENDVKWSLTND